MFIYLKCFIFEISSCTYDYLEITEPTHYDNFKTTKSSKNKNMLNINNSSNKSNSNNNYNNLNLNINSKTFRKRSSYEKPSLSSAYTMPGTSTSTYTSSSNSDTNAFTNTYNNYAKTNAVNTNLNANAMVNVNPNPNPNTNPNLITSFNTNTNYLYSNNYNNYNLAQTNYQKLLHIFSSLYRPHTNYLIQTPDYPRGNPNYPANHHTNRMHSAGNIDTNALPKRLCGDWSSKLKLLRHVSTGSYLGLHFVSDYSHHFGGYKAKTYMENSKYFYQTNFN